MGLAPIKIEAYQNFAKWTCLIWMDYGCSKCQISRINSWVEFKSWSIKAKCWSKYFTTHLTFEWPMNLQSLKLLGCYEDKSSLDLSKQNTYSNTLPHILHLNGLWIFNCQDECMMRIHVLSLESEILIQILHHSS